MRDALSVFPAEVIASIVAFTVVFSAVIGSIAGDSVKRYDVNRVRHTRRHDHKYVRTSSSRRGDK